jgi:hypothetical protein
MLISSLLVADASAAGGTSWGGPSRSGGAHMCVHVVVMSAGLYYAHCVVPPWHRVTADPRVHNFDV